jgi:uncharacterized protein (DUF952 family)
MAPTVYSDGVIYHLIERNEWEQAGNLGAGVVLPEGEVFLHCCDERQLKEVRAAYFSGSADVVALALDPTQLTSETRYEPGSAGEPERFPHVYGPIRIVEVVGVAPIVLDQS